MDWIRKLGELSLDDIALVGGKNASLGEMLAELGELGVQVPDGFAVTASAYRSFLKQNELEAPIRDLLSGAVSNDVTELLSRSKRIRRLISGA